MENNEFRRELVDCSPWMTEETLSHSDARSTANPATDYANAWNKRPFLVSFEESDDLWPHWNNMFRSPIGEDTQQTQSPAQQLPSPSEACVMVDLPNHQQDRRREQNRLAQRTFRERNETKAKRLEKQVVKLQAEQRQMERKYHSLRTAHLQLQSGLKILLDASAKFEETNTHSTSPLEGS